MTEQRTHHRWLPYGFESGPMTVERLGTLPNGRVVLVVKTKHKELHIAASPQGRRLTVTEVQND